MDSVGKTFAGAGGVSGAMTAEGPDFVEGARLEEEEGPTVSTEEEREVASGGPGASWSELGSGSCSSCKHCS